MRKRELQSIPLKLTELKEYTLVKMARNNAEASNEATPKQQASPIANVGPKTKKEIHERLNLTM